MLTRLRAALDRAEDHWLTDLVGVCILFSMVPAVLFAGLVWGAGQ